VRRAKWWRRGFGLVVFAALAAFGCGESQGVSGGRNAGGTDAGTSGASGSGGSSGSSSGAGGSQSGAGGGAGNGTTLDGFRAAFVEAACDNLFSCTWGGDTHDLTFLLGTHESCIDFFDTYWGPAIQVRVDEAGRGGVGFVPEEARRCLSALSHACLLFEAEEPLDAFRGPCAGVFEGAVPEGADCASDEDCSGSALCHTDAFQDPGTCLGHCVTLLPPGSTCTGDVPCSPAGGDGARCLDDGHCVRAVLGEPVAEGERCGLFDQGDNTMLVVGCSGASWCNADSTQVGTCAPPLAVGDVCPSENPPCAGGLCVEANAACVVVTLQKTAGASCRWAEFETCDPFARLTCSATEVCEPIATPGGCASSRTCPTAQFCDDSGQCVPVRAMGEECRVDSDCESRLCTQRMANDPHRCYPAFCSEW